MSASLNVDILPSVALILALTLQIGRTQSFTPDWAAVSGGSGTSTAAVYTLAGAIGQPSAARVYSRDFTIDSGFWSIVAAIQEPGAPQLSVRLTQTNTVLVSWSIASTGFELTESPMANGPNWVPVNVQYSVVVLSDNRVEKHVVVTRPMGNRFYRLRKT